MRFNIEKFVKPNDCITSIELIFALRLQTFFKA